MMIRANPTHILVVDGANFYSDAARYLKRTHEDKIPVGRAYLRDWFDFDRLIQATAPLTDGGNSLGTVIFRSNRSVGKDKDPKSADPKDKGEPDFALTADKETERFWTRQGSASNTSTMLVVVPGSQKGDKETGVDTAIVVHLFETMDQWDTAVLFTADSDFVPAVWSLRRRGKRVLCSFASDNDEDAHRPLVQASQSFIPWNLEFLRADFAMFHFLTAVYPPFSETPEGKPFSLHVVQRHTHAPNGGVLLSAPPDRGSRPDMEQVLGALKEQVLEPLTLSTIDFHIVISGPGLSFVPVIGGVHRNYERWRQSAPLRPELK
jgi:uncharacterized LabA/DUF88 family protein